MDERNFPSCPTGQNNVVNHCSMCIYALGTLSTSVDAVEIDHYDAFKRAFDY